MLINELYSAECDKIFDGNEKGLKPNEKDTSSDSDDNSGFAIVINGHSLDHCLTPELENK